MAAKAPKISIAIGDHIRLKTREANEYRVYDTSGGHIAMREPSDGIVLSIRDISSGRLVKESSSDLTKYVVEIVYDNTFSPRFASVRNVPRTVERATAAPAWGRIRAALRDMAEKGQLTSSTSPDFATDGLLAKALDGWKVIKVKSNDILTLEKPAQPEAAE